MEQRPPTMPKLAWVEEDEEGPGAVPEQQLEEVEQFQLPQEDPAVDRTQEHNPARGRFRRTAQMVCKFIKSIREKETSVTGTGVIPYSEVFKHEASAALLDLLVEQGVSSPEQVPAMVRYIHRWLMANEPAEHRLDNTLLELTEAQPADVVMTLLRVAPSCDRAAATMWMTIMSSPRTAELAQLLLLDVLGNWPEHSMRTSDGDNTDVFALAATVVMWKILQMPCVPHVLILFFPRLFAYLLFQVYFSTLDTPEEVNTFWKGCQEEHGLATNPSRFAVRTLKALLCLLQCEHVVMAMERKCGWDTLLCADTHHYAMGLLAREMRRASLHLCKSILCCLLEMLSKEMPYWDFPALAFLVEVLECLDLSECSDSIMDVVTRHLKSERREMRRLALRVLLLLRDDPSMAERMWSLNKSLVVLLRDSDNDVVRMTIVLLSYFFLDKDAPIPSPIALQLAEALLPLFDHDDSQVQLLSMFVFRTLMSFVIEKEPLKTQVCQSLLPLFFHCHDENQHVAEASWETLLCAVQFLKRRDLENLVKKEKLWKFAECLLAEDRSRAADHLSLALPYLENPQESLRDAAVRFMEIAGRSMRGQHKELQLMCKALEQLTEDISPAVSNLALQTLYALRSLETSRYSVFRRLQDQLRRAWKTRPRLSSLGRLRFWSSARADLGGSACWGHLS
ncbi:maestro heat-like repeat-containing protein family member 7 [Aphelocoma coerulescens]|uniref:maestro heat-like repeat-containing protein family member 7 n=2 Tax=Aphelocoma coerulescens TaxID=39617 RepID=UPI003604CA0C